MAQIIIQSTGQPGDITLTATSAGLQQQQIKIQLSPAEVIVSVPGKY